MKGFAVILSFIVSVLGVGCISEKPEGVVNYVNEGDPVPEFTVRSEDGTGTVSFTSSDFMGKRTVIVLFWTPCGDCRREMPKIHSVWEHFRDADDFRLVAVSRGENAAAVAEYWSGSGYTGMPYYLDPDRSAFGRFANTTVPRLYLVGSDGVVKHMEIERFSPAAKIIELINEIP